MKYLIFKNSILFLSIFCLSGCELDLGLGNSPKPCECVGSACDSVGELLLHNYDSISPTGFIYTRGGKIVLSAGFSHPWCGSVSSVTLNLEHPPRMWYKDNFTVHENRWSFGGNFIYIDIEIPMTATPGNYKCTLSITTTRGKIGGYYSEDYVITD